MEIDGVLRKWARDQIHDTCCMILEEYSSTTDKAEIALALLDLAQEIILMIPEKGVNLCLLNK
jgi:hypothetical protein